MKNRFIRQLLRAIIGVSVMITPLIFAQGPKGEEERKTSVVAFINVNVAPMDRDRALENQTVIIRDGRIAEIGPASKVKVPDGAQRIDGQGKYLMPGLAEMHGHLPHPNQGEAVANSFLTLFVANGVTTVRGMFGFPNHPALRARIAKGEVFGPRLYAASPALSGQSAQSPEQGEQFVRQYKQDGFDLLKVHEGLSVATYDRIVAVANEVGIPADTGRRVIEFRDRMLKALSDAGAKILLGSDAPQLFSVPGFSLQREMEAMAQAGMTPYQILESGTRNAAIYLNAEKEFGTVEVGKAADLILVNGNPLKDVGNVAKRAGVMLRGRWLPEEELAKMLDAIAAGYKTAGQQ
jgi:imidazolonepropionase-like amidohydrolase